jgi:hypothetical protein
MRTITLFFFNEDELGRELNTHTLEFKTDISDSEKLYEYINKTYYMLLDNFSYYSLIED